MNDDEIEFLKTLVRSFPGQVYHNDTVDGVLVPIVGVTDNHRDTDDPQEPPESVAWLGGMYIGKCVGLLSVGPDNFVVMAKVNIQWPE